MKFRYTGQRSIHVTLRTSEGLSEHSFAQGTEHELEADNAYVMDLVAQGLLVEVVPEKKKKKIETEPPATEVPEEVK